MTRLIVRHRENKELNVIYNLNTVTRIIHGKYKDYYDKRDIIANGVKPNDSVLIIIFDDDSVASFRDEYEVIFE